MAYVVATPSPPSQENHFLMPSPLYRSSEVTSVCSIFSWTNHAELIEGNSPTSELINDAKTVAQSLAGITIPKEPPKGVTGVKSDLLLVALLDFAGDEKAQRYTACVIIMAHQENMLFDVAHAWFDHLILPGLSIASFHLRVQFNASLFVFHQSRLRVIQEQRYHRIHRLRPCRTHPF